jgi:hypothetical protein
MVEMQINYAPEVCHNELLTASLTLHPVTLRFKCCFGSSYRVARLGHVVNIASYVQCLVSLTTLSVDLP